MPPGSGASAKTPMVCSANTCPKEQTSRCSRKTSSTTSPGASTPGQEKPWDGKLPPNSSSLKQPSTSSNTGQLESHPLHLYLESTVPHPSRLLRSVGSNPFDQAPQK